MRMAYSVLAEFTEWLEDEWYVGSSIVPESAPDSFVTIERTGGYVEDMLDHPTIAVQCWAATDADAEDMALELRNRLLTDPRPLGVSSIRIESGPYRFYDETTRCPRYQLTLDVTCRLSD